MVKYIVYYFVLSCFSMTFISASEVLVKPKSDHVPFLCKAFELPVAFLNLPRDVQQQVIKQRPSPFKPVRPKLKEVTHNKVKVNDVCTRLEINEESKLIAVFSEKQLFITSLDKPSPDAEVHTFEQGPPPKAMIFNRNGTQLFIRFENEAMLLTLADGKVIEKRICCQIDDTRRPGQCKLEALPDGKFLIVDDSKHIMIFDPSNSTLIEVNKSDIDKPSYLYKAGISLTPQGVKVIFADPNDANSLTPDVFDVPTRTWSSLPLEIAGKKLVKVRHCCYNSDRSLLAVCSRNEIPPLFVHLWDMTDEMPKEVLPPLTGHHCPLFKPNAPYLLVKDGEVIGTTRLYSLKDGAYVMGIPDTLAAEYKFSTTGQYITCQALNDNWYILTWNPWWEELASFFQKPLLLEQYLLVAYLHQLGSCGLSLDSKGVCIPPHYTERITRLDSPLSESDIEELKTVFESLELPVQKYLRLKYFLKDW